MYGDIQAFVEKLRGWRTVIFHALYGVPAAVLAVLELTHEVDITPIVAKFVDASDVPFVLAAIAFGSVFLRWITTTAMGQSRPDGEA